MQTVIRFINGLNPLTIKRIFIFTLFFPITMLNSANLENINSILKLVLFFIKNRLIIDIYFDYKKNLNHMVMLENVIICQNL